MLHNGVLRDILVLRRLVFTDLTEDLLVGGRRRVLDGGEAERDLLTVRPPLVPLRSEERCARRGATPHPGTAGPEYQCLETLQTSPSLAHLELR